MLRISEHSSSSAAKTYYSSHLSQVLGDYYVDGNNMEAEVIGDIHGKLANQIGINGTMTQEYFFDLIDNINPVTKERLTQRTNGEGQRRVGWDIYFDVGGKSLSAAFAGTKNAELKAELLELFNNVVQETMEAEIEPRLMARIRQGGKNESEFVGNGIWTAFTHLTTRPTRVEVTDEKTGKTKMKPTGTADPLIHQHIFLPNVVWSPNHTNRDGSKGAYLAAEITEGIWSQADYLQQNFHARLATKLLDAGYRLKRTETGFDLASWDKEVMNPVFSRRQAEIDAWAKKHGIADNAKAKNAGGKSTRASKDTLTMTMEQQFAEWRDRLPEETWTAFLSGVKGGDDGSDLWPAVSIDQAIDYGISHTMEKSNSATLEEVMYAALDKGMGSVDVDQLQKRLMEREDVISATIGNKTLMVSQEMLEMEQRVRDRAVHGQGSCLPLAKSDFAFRPFASGDELLNLSEDQQTNIQKLLGSHSQYLVLRGAPGVGKSVGLNQLIRGVVENDGQIVALGSTSTATNKLIEEGQNSGNLPLQNARTLASFLLDDDAKQKLNSKSLIILDEATLTGLKQLDQLTELAASKHARLLAVGDYRQNTAVPREGKWFQGLNEVLVDAAELREIRRQKDPLYKTLAEKTSSGDPTLIKEGLDGMKAAGYVQEIASKKERTDKAAELYQEITAEKLSNRGKKKDWTDEQKKEPSMYRSGQTVIRGKGRKAEKLEVVGRTQDGDDLKVLVMKPGGNPREATTLDLSDPKKLTVYESKHRDCLIVCGTHKEGEAVSKKIRAARRQAGELGIEQPMTRLEPIGSFSDVSKQNPHSYRSGMVIEFGVKATTIFAGEGKGTRSIGYGERFKVSGRDDQGRVLMQSHRGETLIAPLQLANRFDVYAQTADRLSVGDKIRMIKNGKTLKHDDKKDVRYNNGDSFTVEGFDAAGNIQIKNGHLLPKDVGHYRFDYYRTSIPAQGMDTSHVVILDSKEMGRARSMESHLVGMSRGKRACTLISDDLNSYRNQVIVTSSQRPSAIELSALAQKQKPEDIKREVKRIEKQQSMLEQLGEFARLATDATMAALAQARKLAEQAKQIGKSLTPKPPINPSQEPMI